LLFSGQSKLVHRNKATGEVAAVWHFWYPVTLYVYP
jgi:hypothetical protein